MQQFQVPQFIEVEDKIFGPLTTKQFFYLVGGGGLAFIFWYIVEFWLFIILASPIIALSVSMAFVKINGQPFINVLANLLGYTTKPKMFLWKKREKRLTSKDIFPERHIPLPTISKRSLNDLAWSLDIMKNVREKEEQ